MKEQRGAIMPYTQQSHFEVFIAYYLITSFNRVENRAKSKSQSYPESELLATGPAAGENSEKVANPEGTGSLWVT